MAMPLTLWMGSLWLMLVCAVAPAGAENLSGRDLGMLDSPVLIKANSTPGSSSSGEAYQFVKERDYRDELLDTPVQDPASKSYFEMVDGSHGMVKGPVAHEGPNWGEAYRLSQMRVYKGVRGRLAIVKSLETHQFLSLTFRPKSHVWIGLRYWCNSRKLQWSDGEMMTPGSFRAWAKEWKQDIYACASTGGPTEYMPVAYSPLPTFDWIGKGINKRYYYFFVEYPVGDK
jgi:lectin-like protein